MQFVCRTLFVTLSLALTGCAFIPVYHPDVQQGNIITQRDVARLKVGMTPAQVLYIMGPPVLRQNFILDRWDYVYTIKKPHQPMKEKRLTIYFQNDKLLRMEGVAVPFVPANGPIYPAPRMTHSKPDPYTEPL